MGRVKASRLNSARTRTRVKAAFKSGTVDPETGEPAPPFQPRPRLSDDPTMRLRQQARAILAKARR